MDYIQAGKNPKLWIRLPGRNLPRNIRPMDIGDELYKQSEALGIDKLSPGDVFSIQYWSKIDSWIIYCANEMAKNKALAMSTIVLNNMQHELTDFQKTNIHHPNGMRVSIHGLPLNVSEEELDTWVDSWATRLTKVERAKEKASKAPRGCSIEPLWNGNRFCYISKFEACVPRHSVYEMDNPLNHGELLQVDI